MATRTHDFDLTNIPASDWIKILQFAGVEGTVPVHENGPETAPYWVWQGKGITIRTCNDPISGKFANLGRREDERGYASYIYLYSEDRELARKVAAKIRRFGVEMK